MPIKIENLQYVYSPKTPFQKIALKDINLEIADGDFFGIIGHTGSGKSTLINHLNALTKIQHGKITVGDIDLTKKFDYKKLRSKVGMVFQYPEYQLFADTVYEDIVFGAKNIGVPKDEWEGRARRAAQLVGLDFDNLRERSPFELSGGQKRRAALAGVLAMQPEILILDEPTAGLDPRGKREILELIKRIKRESCPTIIMISHNMDEIAENCDKIAVLSRGELAGVFAPKDLFANAELITSLGLDLPVVTKIAAELKKNGLTISGNCISKAELVEEIFNAGRQADA